jgi:hypothetical protein
MTNLSECHTRPHKLTIERWQRPTAISVTSVFYAGMTKHAAAYPNNLEGRASAFFRILGQKIRWHALTCLPIERSFADAMTNTMIAGFDTERRVASGPASET